MVYHKACGLRVPHSVSESKFEMLLKIVNTVTCTGPLSGTRLIVTMFFSECECNYFGDESTNT